MVFIPTSMVLGGVCGVSAESLIVDNKQPSIKIINPYILFSPILKEQVTIPFEINKNAKVTAIINDKLGKKVRTILSGKTLKQGHHSISWNGKNANGAKMKDGSYQIVMFAVTDNKISSAKRFATIEIDSIKPSTTLKLTNPILKMDGANTIKAQFKLLEKVVSNAYIIDSRGRKVRKIVTNTTYQSGTVKLNWDGRDDSQFPVSEGRYRYVSELTDLAGNKTVLKSLEFSVQDWQRARIIADDQIYIDRADGLGFIYNITKPGKVSIGIYQNNLLVEEIKKDATYRIGYDSNFIWDLTDEKGVPFPDGNYQYKIHFKDKYGQQTSFTGTIKLARTYPKIKYYDLLMLNMDQNKIESNFTLSQPAKITIIILDDYAGEEIKTIIKNKYFNSGTHYFTWDGSTDSGKLEQDNEYGYLIIAENEHGTQTHAGGKILKKFFPSWLKLIEVEIRSDEIGQTTTYMNFTIESKNAHTKFTINAIPFSSSTSTEPLKAETYLLKSGENDLTYAKPPVSLEYFELIYEDELGNRSTYKLIFK
jgi:flagellar hook assembly protein FlgD